MIKFYRYLIFLRGNLKERLKSCKYKYAHVQSPESLVKLHFDLWSNPQHINFEAFLKVFKILNGRPSRILETGTSAWGTDSTRLWDRYVREYGGKLVSVDLRIEPSKRLRRHMHESTTLLHEDSIIALKRITETFDVYFLDSYDLDFNNPLPSAQHGYLEYLQIKDKLRIGSIIFIDDTPKIIENLSDQAKIFVELYKTLPGKGAFVITDLHFSFEIDVIHHDYSFIAVIKSLTPRMKTN
jgi:hypothetical protein